MISSWPSLLGQISRCHYGLTSYFVFPVDSKVEEPHFNDS